MQEQSEKEAKLIVGIRKILLPLILLVLLIVFRDAVPAASYLNLLFNSSYIIIMIIGMSFVMAGGWVDISCGCQMAVISSVFLVLQNAGWNLGLSIFMCLIAGLFFGVLEGLLISFFKITSTASVITLMFVCYGIAGVVGNYVNVKTTVSIMWSTARMSFMGIPLVFIAAVVSLGIAGVIFDMTFLGRYLRAIKLDASATRKSGVNTDAITVIAFGLASVFFAVAAISRTAVSGLIGVSKSIEFTSAAVLGAHLAGSATSTVKGFGAGYSSWRVIVSALVISSTTSIIEHYGFSQYWLYIIYGVGHFLSIKFGFIRSHAGIHE